MNNEIHDKLESILAQQQQIAGASYFTNQEWEWQVRQFIANCVDRSIHWIEELLNDADVSSGQAPVQNSHPACSVRAIQPIPIESGEPGPEQSYDGDNFYYLD